MADFDKAWTWMKKIEGGYTAHKDDKGGKTNYGITERTARGYGYEGDMKDLPPELAREIAKSVFWDTFRLDTMASQELAQEVFDISYNMGPGVPGKWLQRALNAFNRHSESWGDIKVDGAVGPVTINTANKACKSKTSESNLVKAMNVLQGARYVDLAENPKRRDETFINGWFDHRITL